MGYENLRELLFFFHYFRRWQACTDFALYGLGGLCLILVKMKSHVKNLYCIQDKYPA